jgi:tRNA nucleotidyltransferase (CCA-adding enzyme)
VKNESRKEGNSPKLLQALLSNVHSVLETSTSTDINMKSYLVGGAVRDRLLGMTPTEEDWVVVGTTEQAMLEQGFRHLDSDFPVFLHPETGDEYALARREFKTGVGYKGFTTQATPDVSLEEDLSRRDLTINAIAEDADGKLIDPYHGQQDLTQRRLRHITPAFVDDPVRVLRVARFAAYLGQYNFEVAPETLLLMQQMSRSDDFKHLKRERVWREFKRSLTTTAPWLFITVLQQCGALQQLIPLVDQHVEAAIPTLKRATAASDDPAVRFAFLFYWPATIDKTNIKQLCKALSAERHFADKLEWVVKNGSLVQTLQIDDAEGALNIFEQSRAIRDPQAFCQLTQMIHILWPEKGDLITWLTHLLPVVTAIKAKRLQHLGLQGRALGDALHRHRLEAIITVTHPLPGTSYAIKK